MAAPERHPTKNSANISPADAILSRLNDPTVADSILNLLDHAELLSTLVTGLGGFVERGDLIIDAVAEGVAELKETSISSVKDADLPSFTDLIAVAGQLTAATPLLSQVLESAMADAKTVELLSLVSAAATEGAATARANNTRINGLFATLKVLRDPDVQRALGMGIEVARSLGKRLEKNG